jgi:hypothetical protein
MFDMIHILLDTINIIELERYSEETSRVGACKSRSESESEGKSARETDQERDKRGR